MSNEEIKAKASSVRKMTEALLEQMEHLEELLAKEEEPDLSTKGRLSDELPTRPEEPLEEEKEPEVEDLEEEEIEKEKTDEELPVELDNLRDVSGIGPATAKKLEETGVENIKQLSEMTSKEVGLTLNGKIAEKTVKKWIAHAKELVENAYTKKPPEKSEELEKDEEPEEEKFDPEVDCKEPDEKGHVSFGNPDEFGIYDECVECSIRKECETAVKKKNKKSTAGKPSADGKGYLVTHTDISHLPKGAKEFIKAIGKASWKKAPSPLNWSDILEAMPTMESGVVPDYLGRCQISGCNKEAKIMMFEIKTHLHAFLCGYHFKEGGELFYADEKPPQYD